MALVITCLRAAFARAHDNTPVIPATDGKVGMTRPKNTPCAACGGRPRDATTRSRKAVRITIPQPVDGTATATRHGNRNSLSRRLYVFSSSAMRYMFDHRRAPCCHSTDASDTWFRAGQPPLFHGTSRYAADEAIEEKAVGDGNRDTCNERRRHELSPIENVAAHEIGSDAQRYRLLVGG